MSVDIFKLMCTCLQETFESGLATFQQEGIGGLSAMRVRLEGAQHPQSRAIRDRYTDVMRRWVYICSTIYSATLSITI